MSSNVALSVKDLARLCGVSERIVRRAIARCRAGQTWHDMTLRTAQIVGPGGTGGWRYVIPLSSLSEDLQSRFREQQEATETGSEAPLTPALKTLLERIEEGSIDPRQLRAERHRSPTENDWTRTRVVEAIMKATERGTRERAAMIDSVSQAEGFSPRAVREWVRMAENGKSVLRRVRSDSGNRRVIISRRLDAALRRAGQTDEQILSYRDQVLIPKVCHAYAWRLGTSAQSIIYDLQPDIMEDLRAVGVTLPAAQLRRLSLLPRALVVGAAHHR